jgi:hypothetical protein
VVNRSLIAHAARASPLLSFSLLLSPIPFLVNQNAEKHKEKEGEGG